MQIADALSAEILSVYNRRSSLRMYASSFIIMFDDLKKDAQLIASAVEARLTPQWAAPQVLCRFRRDAAAWEFNYLAPSAQGQSGALLQLTRNGTSRFSISLSQPDTEVPQWRDALHDVLNKGKSNRDGSEFLGDPKDPTPTPGAPLEPLPHRVEGADHS